MPLEEELAFEGSEGRPPEAVDLFDVAVDFDLVDSSEDEDDGGGDSVVSTTIVGKALMGPAAKEGTFGAEPGRVRAVADGGLTPGCLELGGVGICRDGMRTSSKTDGPPTLGGVGGRRGMPICECAPSRRDRPDTRTATGATSRNKKSRDIVLVFVFLLKFFVKRVNWRFCFRE